jgi:hypothetical protein
MKTLKIVDKDLQDKVVAKCSEYLGVKVLSVTPVQLTDLMAKKKCNGWFLIRIANVSPIHHGVVSVLVSLWDKGLSVMDKSYNEGRFAGLNSMLTKYYARILLHINAASQTPAQPATTTPKAETKPDEKKQTRKGTSGKRTSTKAKDKEGAKVNA